MKTLFVHGKPVDDNANRVCVLFDPKSGRVVHVHGVTALPGGNQITDADLEKDAVRHAKNFGCSVDGLKTLHVPFSAIKERGPFKVNAQGTAVERIHFEPTRAGELLAKWRKKSTEKSKP
jgi:hypothetical protein